MSKQLSLFEVKPALRVAQPKKLMTKDAVLKWKLKIFNDQQQTLQTKAIKQTSLFNVSLSHCDSDSINPFALKLHSSQFYRLREHGDRNCIYFVIDNSLPLLLYVGETKQTAKQRWNSVHDCRDYILNYIELHRKYDLEVQVCSAFWYDIPSDLEEIRFAVRKSRLKLESELIKKWQSPFNKENWRRWGQPFGKI